MTRDDVIWVAIRIFGIYLLVLAIVSIPDVIHSGMMVRAWWGMRAVSNLEREPPTGPSDVAKEMSSQGKEVSAKDTEPMMTYLREIERERNHNVAKILSSYLSSFSSGLCKLVLFVACGIYFLRSGKVFFRLISRTGGHVGQ